MLSQNEKELVKSILKSKGWEIIEKMLLEEANEFKKVKTDGKRFEDIAVETIANDKFSKTLASFIRKMNNIKNDKSFNTVVYK